MNLGRDSEVKIYKECGWCQDSETVEVIEVSDRVVSIIVNLLRIHSETEWGAVITVKDGKLIDIKIPKQEVSASDVEFKEDLGGNGTLHSHGSLEAFWSETDNKTFRSRAEYSIVINNKLDYKACRRVKLPCGGWGFKDIILRWGSSEVRTEGLIQKRSSVSPYRLPYASTLQVTPPPHQSLREMSSEELLDRLEQQVNNHCESCKTQQCHICMVSSVREILVDLSYDRYYDEEVQKWTL